MTQPEINRKLDKPRINALLKWNNKAFKRTFYSLLLLIVLQIILSILSILFNYMGTYIIIIQIFSGISLFLLIFLELRSLRTTNEEIYELINETNDSRDTII